MDSSAQRLFEPVNAALVLLCVGGSVLFWHGFRLWRRKRTLEDTPTSRVRSMPLGRVELEGVARAKHELRAPVSGILCVWFRYQVERERRTSKGKRGWVTVAAGDSSSYPFYVEDETGRVLVEPGGATFETPNDVFETNPQITATLAALLTSQGVDCTAGWLGDPSRLRVTEARVHDGDALYAYGVAQPRPGLLTERRQELAARFAEVKADPAARTAADTDGDGALSLEEWEAVRQRVVADVDRRPAGDPIVVAGDPLGAAPFVLSTQPQVALLRSLGWRAFGSVFGGAALALVTLALLLGRLGILGRT
jgi:hypothetical protein